MDPARARAESVFRDLFTRMQPTERLGLARGCTDAGLVKLIQALIGPGDAQSLLSQFFLSLELPDWLRLARLCLPRTCTCSVQIERCLCSRLRSFVRACGFGADTLEARGYCGVPVSVRQLERAERQVTAEAKGEAPAEWECNCLPIVKPCRQHAPELPACPLPDTAERLLLELLDPASYADRPEAPVPSTACSTRAYSYEMADRVEHGFAPQRGDDLMTIRRRSEVRLAMQSEKKSNGLRSIGGQLKGA